jgi:hypothetical protein
MMSNTRCTNRLIKYTVKYIWDNQIQQVCNEKFSTLVFFSPINPTYKPFLVECT